MPNLQGLPPNFVTASQPVGTLVSDFVRIAVIVYYWKMPAKTEGQHDRRWKLKL